MNDKGLIYAGLAIFIALVSFPFWYNIGRASVAPQIVLTEQALAAKECIRSTDYMKKEHMQLLNEWRDAVVRDGYRVFVNSQGQSFNMSLSNTCLDCHSNKAEFCDRCHDYVSVSPYCWDCHIEDPKETK